MKSALFVDFDNVYSGLRRLDPNAAERFARQPMQWMSWVMNSLAAPEHVAEGARRRVLVRRCYLNPQAYQRYRPSFNTAGFEIVDCPALTGEGKTSTDIHMVLDIVDLLQHEAHYDEFILLSADADFTPVLRKLRRWDRRTTVLAIGFPSAAYRASADLLIDQDIFVSQALGIREDEEPVVDCPKERARSEGFSAGADVPAQATPVSVPLAQDPEPQAALRRTADLIKSEVVNSSHPVPCARLATLVQRQQGALARDWNGEGTFRKFVESLDVAPVEFDWSNGGHAYGPHSQAALREDRIGPTRKDWGPDSELLALARQVHEVTDAPLLHPDEYRVLFEALAVDLGAHPFELNWTSKRVRDRCREGGHPMSRADITFVLRGLLFRGHAFGQGKDDVLSLSRTVADNVKSLCLREQMVLDAANDAAITKWIAGGN